MGIRKAAFASLAMGFMYMMHYMTYSLSFWYGTSLVLSDEYTIGNLMTVSEFRHLSSLRGSNKGRPKEVTSLRLICRFSLWCFLERMLWDRPYQTSRYLPVLKELPIKSTASLTRWTAWHEDLHRIQIQFKRPEKLHTSILASYEKSMMYWCSRAVAFTRLHTAQFWWRNQGWS